jgi:hypothetical protein
METGFLLPPQIIQRFSSLLLSMPVPKMRDDSETLWNMYSYIKDKLVKKTAKHPEWENKCKKLEKLFLELYERTLAKEKDLKEKKTHHTQQPFYRFRDPDQNKRRLFTGLKCRSRGFKL